jgi:hypothetical protein
MAGKPESKGQVMVVLSRRALVALVVLPFAIGLLTVFTLYHDSNQRRLARDEAIKISDAKICQRIDKVYEQIRSVAIRSSKSLPGIAYYRTHPDELADALEQNARVIKEFKKQDCGALPSQKTLPGKVVTTTTKKPNNQ